MLGHRIGYIRVSTLDQHVERQLEGIEVDIYGPARAVKGSREEQHISGQMQSYIRPLSEGIVYLRALMKSALPLLNKTSTSRAVSTFRVWGSRSDRSCHQRDHTLHRAGGFLNLLTCCQAFYPVELWTINLTCCSSHPCRLPPGACSGL